MPNDKKTWRERDAAKDKKSSQAPREREPSTTSQAYRSYKSQLNKLFDGGVVPDALKSKIQVTPESKNRKDAAKTILDAVKPADLKKAFAAYTSAFGFPEDEDVLSRLLDLDDEDTVLQALQALVKLKSEGLLKGGPSLKARCKMVQVSLDHPEVISLAKSLVG